MCNAKCRCFLRGRFCLENAFACLGFKKRVVVTTFNKARSLSALLDGPDALSARPKL